jgi:hypothetical protein
MKTPTAKSLFTNTPTAMSYPEWCSRVFEKVFPGFVYGETSPTDAQLEQLRKLTLEVGARDTNTG